MRLSRVLATVGLMIGAQNAATADEPAPLSSQHRAQMEELLEKRVVLLTGALDEDAVTIAIAQLLFLESKGSERVSLLIDSSGGSIVPCLALLDTISKLEAPVGTYCRTRCSGMAAVVLAAGEKGRRHVARGASLDLDIPGWSDIPAAARGRARQTLLRALSDSTGHSTDEIDHALHARLRLDSEQAVAYGLVDAVAPSPAENESGRSRSRCRALASRRGGC